MNDLVICLAQINPTVGALDHNADLMIAQSRAAQDNGAGVVVFPELVVSGYPPEDLVLKRHFIEDVDAELTRIAAAIPPDLLVVAGAPVLHNGLIYNAAVLLQGGRRLGAYHKMCLPNYGVFDEKRVFAPGQRPGVLAIGNWRIGLHVCEDSWSVDFPSCQAFADANLDALINISASPYHRGKSRHRRDILSATARFLNTPLLYCNLTGGQDELVFDGGSMAFRPDGAVAACAKTFAEDLIVYALPEPAVPPPEKSSNHWNFFEAKVPIIGTFSPRPAIAPPPPDDTTAEVYAALRMGLADYVNKNGFNRVIVALSGGIDSALVAAIAVDALGPERVVGITMPSRYSSAETHGDAGELARRLGVEFHDVPIRGLHEHYLTALTDLWPGRASDTTEENLQARIRGNIVMALSNKFGWLVLTTGNKSEMATGYCTLYGDMAGGFALLKDVPKTLVFELSRWRNSSNTDTPIPETTIHRAPSAELRENQKDEDSLPPYVMLDPVIERYVERDWSAEQIVADGFPPDIVTRVISLVDGNEYKRRQGPPGIKITPKAFGRDRRLPITNLYHERVKRRKNQDTPR